MCVCQDLPELGRVRGIDDEAVAGPVQGGDSAGLGQLECTVDLAGKGRVAEGSDRGGRSPGQRLGRRQAGG